MRLQLTTDNALEILKRYDPQTYEYYINNTYFIGSAMKNYASYLLECRQNEKEPERE